MRKAKNKASAEAVTEKAADEVSTEQLPTEKAAKKENPLEVIGKKMLAEYPDKTEAFISADGFCFFEKCDAENYARNLKDTTITTVKR